MCEEGDSVGADLVGGVAVGGDAVGSDDDCVDAAFAHDLGGHVVADEGDGDAAAGEFPGGEASTLEEGTGFVGVDMDGAALVVGGEEDSECGSVVGRGQAAGVAVGEDALA